MNWVYGAVLSTNGSDKSMKRYLLGRVNGYILAVIKIHPFGRQLS